MSGLDILTVLNHQNRPILTIMITAYATFETAVQATKLGAYDFLPKPFSPDELRYAVRKATDQLILSKEARRLAEEKRQVRFNFISVLAHELKAPLNAIEGYLRILQTDEPPERKQMIDRSLIRLDGMKKLIFDLLDLTRIESGQKVRNFVPVDVRALAKSAADLFSAEAAERHITIDLKPEGPVEMVADPSEIEIVLNNLISNAVKYNRDGGSVTVEIRRRRRNAQSLCDRHRHRPGSRGGRQALLGVRPHQERGHHQGHRQRPGALHRPQARSTLRRRCNGRQYEGVGEHVHRDLTRYPAWSTASGQNAGRARRRSRNGPLASATIFPPYPLDLLEQ